MNQNRAKPNQNRANVNQNCANESQCGATEAPSICSSINAAATAAAESMISVKGRNKDGNNIKGSRGYDVKGERGDVKEATNVSLVSLSSNVSSKISGIPKTTTSRMMTKTTKMTKATKEAPRLPSIEATSKESLALSRARELIMKRK